MSASEETEHNVSLSGQVTNVDKSLKEKKWEEVQIKAFTAWLNSILAPRGLEVSSLTEDLKDGLRLVGLCEVTSGKTLRGIDKKPMIPIQKINNIDLALKFLRSDMQVRLDLIGAEDVYSGNLKMTLGMIFAIFRKVVQGKLANGEAGESQEVGLLKWIREQTDGYAGVKISDFRSSFNDGLAFNALVHRFDPTLFDYNSIDKTDKQENLKRAFTLAEKHLGVPQLLDANELIAGEADERSVILYSSLYFHAFVSNEERLKAMRVQSGLTHEIEDTKTQLSKAQAELDAARSRQSSLEHDNSELLARLAKLEEQLGFYKQARNSDAETMDLLSQKVNVLGNLLEDEKGIRSAAEQARFRLQQEMEELLGKLSQTEKHSEQELEEMRKRLEALREQEARDRREVELARQKLAETQEDFDRAMEEAERRKKELAEQIASLRKAVADERAFRKQREAEVQALRNECEQLRRSAISQSKARSGLALLKRNLEEHLEDMYKWRDLHHGQTEENRFNLAQVVADTTDKTFEQTLTYLDEKLMEENHSLLRIVQLQDANLQDRIEKEGVLRMKFRKDWSKRFFRVTGNKLSWYAEDGNGRREGTVDLSKQCEIVRQKALKSDEPGIAKYWPLKLTVVLQVKQGDQIVDQEKKLFIRAASKKERHAWFSLISGKIASFNYRQSLEKEANARPDTRVLTFLHSSDDEDFFADGRPMSHQAVLAISKVLAGHDQLQRISISDAALTSDSVNALAEGLVKTQAVVSVALAKNNIADDAGANLVQRLATLDRITSLDLHGNQLASGFVSALAADSEHFKGLAVLNVSDNHLGHSAGALAAAVKQAAFPIQHLQLAKNSIPDEALAAVGELLHNNETITTVDLSGNHITDDGLRVLATALHANQTLRSIDLSGNRITAVGVAAIQTLLSNNRFLDEIKLAHNPVAASDLSALSFPGFGVKELSVQRHVL